MPKKRSRTSRQSTRLVYDTLGPRRLLASDLLPINVDSSVADALVEMQRAGSPSAIKKFDAVEALLDQGETSRLQADDSLDFTVSIADLPSARHYYHNGNGLEIFGGYYYALLTEIPNVEFGDFDQVVDIEFTTSADLGKLLSGGVNRYSNQRFHFSVRESNGEITLASGTSSNLGANGYESVIVNLEANATYTARLEHTSSTLSLSVFDEEGSQLADLEVPYSLSMTRTLFLTGGGLGTPTVLSISDHIVEDLNTTRDFLFEQFADLTLDSINREFESIPLAEVPDAATLIDYAESQSSSDNLVEALIGVRKVLGPEIQSWQNIRDRIEAVDSPKPHVSEYRAKIESLLSGMRSATTPYSRGKVTASHDNMTGRIELLASIESADGAFEVDFIEDKGWWGESVVTKRVSVIGEGEIDHSFLRRSNTTYRVVVREVATGEVIRSGDYYFGSPNNHSPIEQKFLEFEAGLLVDHPLAPSIKVLRADGNGVVVNVTSPFDKSIVRVAESTSPLSEARLAHEGGVVLKPAVVSLDGRPGSRTLQLLNQQGAVLDEFEIVVDSSYQHGRYSDIQVNVNEENRFSAEAFAGFLSEQFPVVEGGLSKEQILSHELAREALILQSDQTFQQAEVQLTKVPRGIGASWQFNRWLLKYHSEFYVNHGDYLNDRQDAHPELFPDDVEAWIHDEMTRRHGFTYTQVRRSLFDRQRDQNFRWGRDLDHFLNDLEGVLDQAEKVLHDVREGRLGAERAEYELNERLQSTTFRIPEGLTRPTNRQLLQEVQRLQNDSDFVEARHHLLNEIRDGAISSHYADPALRRLYDSDPREADTSFGQNRAEVSESNATNRRLERVARKNEAAIRASRDPRAKAIMSIRQDRIDVTINNGQTISVSRPESSQSQSEGEVPEASSLRQLLSDMDSADFSRIATIAQMPNGERVAYFIGDDGTIYFSNVDSMETRFVLGNGLVLELFTAETSEVSALQILVSYHSGQLDELNFGDGLVNELDSSMFQFTDDLSSIETNQLFVQHAVDKRLDLPQAFSIPLDMSDVNEEVRIELATKLPSVAVKSTLFDSYIDSYFQSIPAGVLADLGLELVVESSIAGEKASSIAVKAFISSWRNGLSVEQAFRNMTGIYSIHGSRLGEQALSRAMEGIASDILLNAAFKYFEPNRVEFGFGTELVISSSSSLVTWLIRSAPKVASRSVGISAAIVFESLRPIELASPEDQPHLVFTHAGIFIGDWQSAEIINSRLLDGDTEALGMEYHRNIDNLIFMLDDNRIDEATYHAALDDWYRVYSVILDSLEQG